MPRHGLTAEVPIEGLEDAEDYEAFQAAVICNYDRLSSGRWPCGWQAPCGDFVVQPGSRQPFSPLRHAKQSSLAPPVSPALPVDGTVLRSDCVAAECDLAERVMDGHAINLVPMTHVLGEELLAINRAGSRNNCGIPV
jgi:hypothetical protein